ncbi:sulfatase-like hydrolase/transferase [Candidatus Sumerlaeota bacterium]|nr:sulfatase-like hydrolase/transferase [Candidatus Sumerlaeota bacterium]
MNNLDRRGFIRNAAASAATAVLPNLAGAARPLPSRSAARRPNFVFLYSDDQRFDTIHALGNDEVITPTMDWLVHNGVAFTHAFIMGATQGAVCVPSRGTLMTGRTMFRWEPVTDYPLLPEVLGKAGYKTFGIGKWHSGPPAFAKAFTDGANIFFGGMSDHLKAPVQDYDPTGKYLKKNVRIGEKFSSELFSDSAIRFLREYKSEDPFFLYVAFTAPHDPRMAPKRWQDKYPPDKIALPKNFMPEHPFDNGELKCRDELLAPWPRTPEVVRQHIADYYAMISHLDEQMGRVLDALREGGHSENTFVVFTGDNGLAVGQHGLFGKQSVYEHSARVPLVVVGPGIAKDKRCDAFCYQFDLNPTICELAGVPIPETVEGKSIVPLITGQKQRIRQSVFGVYRDFQRMARDERFKLIEYYVGADGHGTRTTQLFDITSDPWELNNLASDGKYAGQLERLRAELAKWQREVGDPLLKKAADKP